MKHLFTILSHEIRMLLVNPGTYLAAALFLALMGYEFSRILEIYSQAPQETMRSTRSWRRERSASQAHASGTPSDSTGATASAVEICRPDSPSARRCAGMYAMLMAVD